MCKECKDYQAAIEEISRLQEEIHKLQNQLQVSERVSGLERRPEGAGAETPSERGGEGL